MDTYDEDEDEKIVMSKLMNLPNLIDYINSQDLPKSFLENIKSKLEEKKESESLTTEDQEILDKCLAKVNEALKNK